MRSAASKTTRKLQLDLPLDQAVTQFLMSYVEHHLPILVQPVVTPDTPLFWSSWGQRRQGKTRPRSQVRTSGDSARPMAGSSATRC